MIQRLAPLLAPLLLAGCAVKNAPVAAGTAAPTAFEEARAALREAEAAQAERFAPDLLHQAAEQLRLAESTKGSTAREAALRAEGLARLAAARAQHQAALAAEKAATAAANAAAEKAEAEAKQVREENRRLEERTALLLRALDQTEAELVRSKARLRGGETKAEAASAIAEARILMRRLGARSAAAALCRDSVAKAEEHLASGNYGAAMSFALRAQDIASQALAPSSRP